MLDFVCMYCMCSLVSVGSWVCTDFESHLSPSECTFVGRFVCDGKIDISVFGFVGLLSCSNVCGGVCVIFRTKIQV